MWWDQQTVKSPVLSSFVMTGNAVGIQGLYRTIRDKYILLEELHYSTTTLHSSSGGLPTQLTYVNGQISYTRKIQTGKQKLNFFAGVVLDNTATIRTTTPRVSLGTQQEGEYMFSLNPSFLMGLPVGKDWIYAQGWAAVVAYVRQSGYSNSPVQEKNILGPSTFKNFGARISYCRNLSDRWQARLDYQFQLYGVQRNETVTALSHQLVASILYKWKGKVKEKAK